MNAETRYAKDGDVHIAYRVFGNGPRDMVLVPGTVSHVELYWELPANAYLLRRLASFARVIVFDKRGQGLSDRVADQTIEERVGDLLAVMDAAGSARATVYGWSEGGQLCMTFAATHSERVERLVLYGSYASIDQPPWAVTPERFARFLQAVEAHWGEGVLVRLNAPSRVNDEAFVRWFGRLERAVASPGSIVALMRANHAIDVDHLLPSIHVPTLIFHRAGDALVPAEAGRHLARRIPGARYVELPGDDHMLQALDQEVLDTLVDEIERFVCPDARHVADAALARERLASDVASDSAGCARVGEAIAELERSREILASGETGLAGVAARAEAVAAASRGAWEESEAQFVKAAETFRRHGMLWQEARTIQSWGDALRDDPHRRAALDAVDAMIPTHRRSAGTPAPAEDAATGADAGVPWRPVFRREGDYWTMSWRGDVVRLKDAKGLHYIAYLLANPGRPVLAAELATAGATPDTRRASIGADTTAPGLGDAGALLDAKAREQYRRRMQDLREDLAEAVRLNDTLRAARARAELEFLRDQIAGAVGLGGRDRKAASHSERARLMVTKAIKASLTRIRAGDAALGRHLATSIKTGNCCAYDPGTPPVVWQL